MPTSFAQFDGPRLMRREELIASERLFHICFGGPEIENEEQMLADYIPPKQGGTYVLIHEGKLVSQIVTFHDPIKIYDGTIRTGSIGGVCTHPDYRRQGLAGHLLEHCTQQLAKEGAQLILISGDGGLYTRYGNVLQGKYCYFSIQSEQSGQWQPTPTNLVLRRATSKDALLCSQLYQAEPVHFVRQKSDFSVALQDPMGDPYIHADPWIIEREGEAMAYLFLGIPYGINANAGIRHVSEYAGSRTALADSIPELMKVGNLQSLSLPAAWQDREFIQLLQASDYSGNMAPLDGHTLRIINFPNLMKALRPMIEARLDARLLRGLHFEQNGPLLGGTGADRHMIARGSERLELDGAAMTRLVMGSRGSEAESIPVSGALAEVISALFPLPSFLPGLNYH
jgi:GNAT superfamily N-acetyltransferase